MQPGRGPCYISFTYWTRGRHCAFRARRSLKIDSGFRSSWAGVVFIHPVVFFQNIQHQEGINMARSSITQKEAKLSLASILQCRTDAEKSRTLAKENESNKMLASILEAGATKMEFHAEYLEQKLLRACVKNATKDVKSLHKFIEANIPNLSDK